jgi:hydrogenase nickel incorporation protein HypA/HybF
MHEQSIVESLLFTALKNAEKEKASKILKICVVVGDLTGVEEDAVNFYFGFVSKNTIAAEASISYTHVPMELRCRECETIFKPEKYDLHCPNCNEQQVDIVAGRELYVDSIEVE